ncbi:MAG: DUF2974 domain-containing protein [Pseudomonadota bacterium]|nr:DUF2974 domain-containing protein [Pseudomonadota bacterium]
METKTIPTPHRSSDKASLPSEWLLLRVIDLVSDIENYPFAEFEQGIAPRVFAELKALSWELYRASHWTLSDQSVAIGIDHDYLGIILVNHTAQQIILAHRGLQLTSLKNLVAGLTIGNKQSPEIVESALQFCEMALTFAEQHNYTLHHTGFSLGGFLAQVTGAHCNHKARKHNSVVCFDAPGATPTITSKAYADNPANTINYVTAPNVVNTSNQQYGYVRQIKAYHGKNIYLTATLKPHIVDNRTTLHVEHPSDATIDVFKEIIYSTVDTHDHDALKNILGTATGFDYTPVQGWPLSSLTFENIEAPLEKIPLKLAGWIVEMLLAQAKEILTLAGHGDCNAVSYQLKTPTVYLHNNEQPEIFCVTSNELAASNLYRRFISTVKPNGEIAIMTTILNASLFSSATL